MSLPREKKDSIRLSIVSFALFIATMLVQTNNSSVGTIVAFVCLSSIIIFSLAENGVRFKANRSGVSLVLFALLITIVTIVKTTQSFRLPRLILQIAACVILLTVQKVNKREERLLIWVYILSTTFYSLLLLYSIFSQGHKTHGDFSFLGTSFDPNFMGLPFAVASALELHFLINKRHKALAFVFLLLCYVSSVLIVVLSASRGSAFSFVLSNLIVLFLYLTRKNKSVLKKVIVLSLVVGVGAILVSVFYDMFSNAVSRILTIGESGSDNGRFELWKSGIEMWKNNLFVGGGFYANYESFGRAVHNTYIEVLSESGIVGFALLCPYLFRAIKKCLLYNRYMFGALIALLIQIFFLDALDNRVFWVVFCWVAVLPDRAAVQEQQTE